MVDLTPEQFDRAKQAVLEAIELPVSERAGLITQRTSDDDLVMQHALKWLKAYELEPEATIGTVQISHDELGQVLSDRVPTADVSTQVVVSTICPECGAAGARGAFVCPDDGEILVDSTKTIAGKTIDGVYRVGRRLGKGGMGSVYEASHEFLKHKVAIKVIAAEYANNAALVERFKREGQAVMAVDHPNLVKLYELKPAADGTLYMVLEFVDGETLGAMLRRKRCLTIEEAMAILGPVADALDTAHEVGVVHRDLKPDNIMVSSRNGRPVVKLMDLGIARLRYPKASERAAPTLLTQPGAILGTPGYMSPEQMLSPDSGELEIDGRADVYSLGVVFHEVLNGCRPYEGRLPKPIEQLPEGVTAAIHRALSRDRHKRQSSAGELVAEIRRAMEDEVQDSATEEFSTLMTSSSSMPDKVSGRVGFGSRSTVLAGGAVIVIAVVAIAGFGIRGWNLWPAEQAAAPVPPVSQPARSEILRFWFEVRAPNGNDWIPLNGPVPVQTGVRFQFESSERKYLYLIAQFRKDGEYTALISNFDEAGNLANELTPGATMTAPPADKAYTFGTEQPQTRLLFVLAPVPLESYPSLARKPKSKLSASELVAIEALVAETKARHVDLEQLTVDGRNLTLVLVNGASIDPSSTIAFELVVTPEQSGTTSGAATSIR